MFLVVQLKPTPRCGDLLWSRVTLNPSQVIQRSNLSAILFFLISQPICEESPQDEVSHALHKIITIKIKIRVREGDDHTHKSTIQQHTQESQRNKRKNSMSLEQLETNARISLQ
jgi:hypothetical protein